MTTSQGHDGSWLNDSPESMAMFFRPWENLPGKPWEIGAPQHFLENQTPQQLHYGLW